MILAPIHSGCSVSQESPALPDFIVTRSGWGGRPPITSELQRLESAGLHDTLLVVVHHTATRPGVRILDLQLTHMMIRGFADIGYHFIVDPSGRVFEGRDITMQGAHAHGHNSYSIGVALQGTFTDEPPSSAALASLGTLLGWLCDSRHPALIKLHTELDDDTDCPGAMLAHEMTTLVAARATICLI